jgi:predicted RNase H-like nuclease (RuvC/YqgF family)
LDYTYYNLLERISTLHSTIHTFQELVDSSATLHENFQRDNSALESDIHRQLADFAKFDPQRQRIDELERRMKAGRRKMENLGERLDKIRREIEGWERREGEWQARVTQRLRVLGGFVAGLVLMVIVVYALRSSPTETTPTGQDLDSRIEMLSQSGSVPDAPTDTVDVDVDMKTFLKSPLFTKSTTDSDETIGLHDVPIAGTHSHQSSSNSNPADPLRLFDEL